VDEESVRCGVGESVEVGEAGRVHFGGDHDEGIESVLLFHRVDFPIGTVDSLA